VSAEPARSIGVIRPQVFAGATSATARRRPLNRALDRALGTLAQRLERFRLTPADESVDFFWNRPAPRLPGREHQVRNEWHFSPTILVDVPQFLAASSRDAAAPQPVKLGRSALPSPVLMRTIERQIEIRVFDRTNTVLRPTLDRRRPEASARTFSPAAGPVAASRIVVRTDAPVVRTEMVVVRSVPRPEAPNPVVSPSTHDAAALQKSASPSPATPAAALRLERITTEVIRALDARDIARRERMGRS